MALKKEVKYDKIEIVGDFKTVQLRQATIITEGGVEISRSFHRSLLNSDADISGESKEVQDVCNVVWTNEVKKAWADEKEAQGII
jgi:hypothetical protein